MTPEVLGRKLGSTDPRERLEAARFLVESAQTSHAGQIEAALGIETVGWVRGALRRALQKVRPNAPAASAPEASELSAVYAAQIYSDALETTAAQLIHEIEPILGSLRLSAEADVPNFDASDTARGLDRLDALVASLSRLRRAASAPKVEELALDRCIYAWVEEEAAGKAVRVLRAGPQDCTVEGDKGLICLSFVNGLRNAIDATKALETENDKYPDITVNWGATDIDAWVAIVDSGVGFRGNVARAFDIGSTTKAGHLGMGLATAQQAMTSMDGSVRLIPGERGVRFEMRWPKAGA
ncbi:sensor histidine kinase [Rhizorhabdus phycosphaerae]|uniref:sensor histidine kinase n=1 Tax=Rhizorhabdus phycosphaerae TaxID=2711156 RepID=UPI0013ECB884|nr:HAMP domain-containing sensor histidine kinase [Rhizorhabdus phycosphaerae]